MQSESGRVPPYNLDAERSVLGACLIQKDALYYAVETLRPTDFYDPRHVAAFELMTEMSFMDRAVDNITFADELQKRSMMDRVGGPSFVAMLVDCVTTTANIEHHCAIVKDKAIHRLLISAGSDIAKIGFSEDVDHRDALAEAERMVFDIAGTGAKTEFKGISEVLTSTFSQIERRISDGAVEIGVRSGLRDFDRLTGGFQPGSLNIIAARPSMGKTALALNIAQRAALEDGVNVLLFSLEMSAEQIAGRLLSSEAKVNIRELESAGSKIRNDQWNALTNAAARLSGSPIFIDDSAELSTLELRSKCRRFFSKHRDERSMVIVDYLQLMSPSKKTESRQQDVSDISRSLKGVAREFDIPLIALSQLSREVEKRGSDKRPMLSDLRDSGAIEQDADVVAFLYRPAYYEHDSEASDPSAELAIAKHRNGPTGKVDLVFYKEFSRFESRSPFQGQ